mmetsp:Transcript_99089/g.284913  ORF Transcript_99089/g.284913 Transcript_99089/m.284913 type:complete len:226 (+) Transcript_99089:1256-1933(+)
MFQQAAGRARAEQRRRHSGPPDQRPHPLQDVAVDTGNLHALLAGRQLPLLETDKPHERGGRQHLAGRRLRQVDAAVALAVRVAAEVHEDFLQHLQRLHAAWLRHNGLGLPHACTVRAAGQHRAVAGEDGVVCICTASIAGDHGASVPQDANGGVREVVAAIRSSHKAHGGHKVAGASVAEESLPQLGVVQLQPAVLWILGVLHDVAQQPHQQPQRLVCPGARGGA